MAKQKLDHFLKNPKKAIFILAIPAMIGMFVQVMYNIVDTAYVGRLGAEAIAALTFAFPIFFILISFNSGLGMGMNSRVSRFLGAKEKKNAENTAMHGILLSVAVAALIFGLSLIFIKPLFMLFGAEDSVLNISLDYISIVMYGIFFMFPTYMIAMIFSAQGDTRTPTKIQVAGLVMNIILDPIFIYSLDYGVNGVAIATVISILFSFLVSLYYLKKGSYLKLSMRSFSFSPKLIYEIFAIGLPASLMMILISIYVIFINRLMAHFGTIYVAAFGMVSRLESVITMPVVAFSVSLLTLAGMFHGAKRFDLIKDVTSYTMKVVVGFTLISGAIFLAFPKVFLIIFTGDAELLRIGAAYLRLDVLTFPLMAISMIISRALQGMGYGFPSLVIQAVRIFIVALPLAYLSVYVFGFGYLSVAVAMVLGGIASSVVALVWFEAKLKKLIEMHRVHVG
ncbi:hypothetical protein COV19_01810 [Candidatus Woesearchaeota archaeon CG10_big_fil_rev_8_21_14_0_10_44_13]|nr:MAG: hypothetical protein COV19_01810 [Candidatus Woesearchaeota archaeon CG10_big_fil_rev_8_21_14_0_10_44_13]